MLLLLLARVQVVFAGRWCGMYGLWGTRWTMAKYSNASWRALCSLTLNFLSFFSLLSFPSFIYNIRRRVQLVLTRLCRLRNLVRPHAKHRQIHTPGHVVRLRKQGPVTQHFGQKVCTVPNRPFRVSVAAHPYTTFWARSCSSDRATACCRASKDVSLGVLSSSWLTLLFLFHSWSMYGEYVDIHSANVCSDKVSAYNATKLKLYSATSWHTAAASFQNSSTGNSFRRFPRYCVCSEL